jgi:hypothetical protein
MSAKYYHRRWYWWSLISAITDNHKWKNAFGGTQTYERPSESSPGCLGGYPPRKARFASFNSSCRELHGSYCIWFSRRRHSEAPQKYEVGRLGFHLDLFFHTQGWLIMSFEISTTSFVAFAEMTGFNLTGVSLDVVPVVFTQLW